MENVFEVGLGIEHHMVSHTEVTNHFPLSYFSVNEIIGRDMSQISVSQGTGASRQAPLPGPDSLDLGRSDGLWQCSLQPHVYHRVLLSMFLSLDLGFPTLWPSRWSQELGSPYVGKAAFLQLRPWVDFVKEQEQHRLLELWGNELCFLYLNRILLYDGCFECECSRLSISEVLLLQVTWLLS